MRAVGTRESAYNRAQEKIQAQDELIQMLEGQIKAARETAELQIEELQAQLQREQLDRTMAEGALEAGRKDIARLLRETLDACSTGRAGAGSRSGGGARPERGLAQPLKQINAAVDEPRRRFHLSREDSARRAVALSSARSGRDRSA